MGLLKTLLVKLTSQTDQYRSDMSAATRQTEQFAKGAQTGQSGAAGLSGGIGGLGKVVGGLVASGLIVKAGQMALGFAKDSIQAASDVGEMRSKFNTVFKDLSGDVQNELAAFAEAANRSKYDLMGFAATFQDTFVPLGFARDQAAAMSVQLVQLATDLASFNNLNTADVARDLQSALVGNTETLRKYGVVAQETQIKAKALEMGLWNGKGAIDAQAKAYAILQLTIDGTADAQGDAIRTSDSFANQMVGLESATKNLKVALGEALIPTLEKGIPVITGWVNSLAKAIEVENSLDAAARQGIITQAEANEQINRYTWTAYSAADAQQWLNDRVDAYNARMEVAQMAGRGYVAAVEEQTAATEELANTTQDVGDAAVETKKKTEDWLSSMDVGLSNTLGSMLDTIDFIEAGGPRLQQAGEQLKQALLEKKLTPQEADSYFAQLYASSQALDVELGKIDTYTAAKNIREKLGGSLQDALNLLETLKGEAKFNITSTITIKINQIETAYKGTGRDYGARQHGGAFGAFQPLWVGETGMEAVVPTFAGRVLTTQQAQDAMRSGGSGGGIQVVQTFQFYGPADPQQVKAAAGSGVLELARAKGIR